MSEPAAKLHPLAGNQRPAVDPARSVWLSASAGTGKTQVLTARVLRLLLEPGVRPDQILCLTFTKAGATEMAARINDTLARWVRADEVALGKELAAIDADFGPETRARARTLFAAVLDCPGGGLRIDTIHAFAQWLLAAFPEEAGLSAGARPMEEHEKLLLSRQVLADLLLAAEARGDHATLDALAALSLRLGEDKAQGFLMACAEARDLWLGADGRPAGWAPPLRAHVHRLLGLAADASEADLAALCDDGAFDVRSLEAVRDTWLGWTDKKGNLTATAEKRVPDISAWLAAAPQDRLANLETMAGRIFKDDGDPAYLKNLANVREDYAEYCARVAANIEPIRQQRALLALAAWLAPALELGRAYALAWDEAKAREGLIDFDDQIRRAAALLGHSDMADWIRYKLDRRFDHILVDEAQDTNAAQWRIIDALTGDFFAGEGARGNRIRTLFVVGDYKQAIFGFQGTSPENFNAAKQNVKAAMEGAAGNAGALRGGPDVSTLLDLGLGQSFRTAKPVLDFVDAAIAAIGPSAFGLTGENERHVGEDRPGVVTLWRPVGLVNEDDEEDDEEGDNGLSSADYRLADQIARQVRQWDVAGYPLVKGVKPGESARKGGAGDVMVLVRKRRELAGLIVARLHAAGVKVAGVNRLRLGAPLAVKDLVAALRFAAQPLDDLTLANLLVSPLIGWTQEQLLAHGWRAPEERQKGLRLWEHLRRSSHADVAAAMERLGQLLARADYEPVQALLHWLLVGPWRAREALVSRLGHEANDPIDELLNAAQAFAATATPSLAGFLAWFDASDGELKREAGRSDGMVRVMTVHGSKGLQAPIVILADATGDPARSRGGQLALPDPASVIGGGEAVSVPLPPLRAEEKLGPIADAAAAAAKAEGEEHWRLLYVAMTRAEEALFVTGAVGAREKIPAEGSWYAALAGLFADEAWQEDPIWGATAQYGTPPPVPHWPAQSVWFDMEAAKPGWLTRPAPEEARPARPLVPSALGEDLSAEPPMAGGASAPHAARRGTLIHRLLERLPDLAPGARVDAAARWLASQAADLAPPQRAEIAEAALRVLAEPGWAALFSPYALAEVPLAALVDGQVISGTIDRLLIEADTIRIVDFKTTRRPPVGLAGVPVATLRQMAAYAAALEVTYPGRTIEAAVLYTTTPALIEIPRDVLEATKQSLGFAQQSFAL